MDGVIRPEVLEAMINENTATWESHALSMASLPSELFVKLWCLFEPEKKEESRKETVLAMIKRAIQTLVDGVLDDELLELMMTYRNKIYENTRADSKMQEIIECFAVTAISLTFLPEMQ